MKLSNKMIDVFGIRLKDVFSTRDIFSNAFLSREMNQSFLAGWMPVSHHTATHFFLVFPSKIINQLLLSTKIPRAQKSVIGGRRRRGCGEVLVSVSIQCRIVIPGFIVFFFPFFPFFCYYCCRRRRKKYITVFQLIF